MAGVWQHLVATYDGSTKRLFVDGAEVASIAEPVDLPYDTNPIYIGCDDNGSLDFAFAGALDDVQIYNRALTLTEIAGLAAR